VNIEGCIIGFNECMNLVLDDGEDVHVKSKKRKELMFKGGHITLPESEFNRTTDAYRSFLSQR
uniref:Uncharacterized protein n=1 Tax=Dicentrarchus labrax TaxID=13489 RepID=A0A8C4EDV5_DICLA